jgi:hypothetical protein
VQHAKDSTMTLCVEMCVRVRACVRVCV